MEYSNSQARELIAEYVHSQRDRLILEDRLINGITFEKLAEKYELSVVQVKRIVYRCEKDIFSHLK